MTSHIVKVFLALGLAVLIYFIGMPGCSTVQFGSIDPSKMTVSCEELSEIYEVESCQTIPGPGKLDGGPVTPVPPGTSPSPAPPKHYEKIVYKLSAVKADIIFVVDNSSSMAKEHRNLAKQFESFLTSIKNVDYHIAVITTDISSSPENPVRNAYYQDGKFIPIGRRIFLQNENIRNRPSQSVIEDFQRAIVRDETDKCDTPNQPRSSGNQYDNLYSNVNEKASIHCPSHDERGTYALNLAIRNPTHDAFFRSFVIPLIIVYVGDEDIRSGEEYINQPGFEEYAFEAFDQPETLVENIYNRFSNPAGESKKVNFHSIIIIPGDSQCLNEQNSARDQGEGTGRGFYGKEYARLSEARDPKLTKHGNLLKGSLISICKRNYSSQLNKVALSANTIRVTLPCREPESIDLYVDDRKIRPNYTIEEGILTMEPGQVQLTSDLKLQIICELL